ncbi:MAG TPA: class III extradiol ring-cleavage dioxygenase [Candidatus Cybelea sp.]|nr:class III extradiol ring-cleavage dioxygenase [Candidatus Cybelea sp.]
MQPSIFVSHGSPTLAIEHGPAVDFLSGLGKAVEAEFGRPRAILCASAHWETPEPAVSTAKRPETIYDFYGFPEELYRLSYPAPGAPDVAGEAMELIGAAGLPCSVDPAQGLDHGAWMPLRFMWPDAKIPVAQVAIQHHLGPAHHVALGRALAPLRSSGVLLLGSGGAVHNLRDLMGRRMRGETGAPEWAVTFDDWLERAATAGDGKKLIDYRREAPGAAMAHPRDEHLLPLHFAFGAGGERAGRTLHKSFGLGSLSMAAYAFH